MNILASFSDLVWPRPCEVCGRASDRPGRHVCSACLMRLPFVPPVGCCRVCGRCVEGAAGRDFLCEDCAGPLRPCFDRAASALRFEGDARAMILAFKFNRHLWLRDDFADWLEGVTAVRFDSAAPDVVLPMPTTLFHRLDRGYNQAGLLAKALAARLGRRFDAGVLRRRGHPVRQSSLGEFARRDNARDTFAVRHPERIRGRTVLVVDDILTTGATLSECARALKEAGAWRVFAVTLARSIRD